MPATSISLTTSLVWQLQFSVGGFAPRTEGDSLDFSLAGLDLNKWDQTFAAQVVVPAPSTAGDSIEVDLYTFVNLVCEGVLVDRVLAIQVLVSAPNGGEVEVGPGVSNPLQWFFGNLGSGIKLDDGAMFLFSRKASADGELVSPTSRNLIFTNLSSHDITVTIGVICSSTVSPVTDLTA